VSDRYQLLVVLLIAENDTTLAISASIEKSTASLASVDVTSPETMGTGMIDEARSVVIVFDTE